MKNKMKLFATFALCFFSYKSLFAQNVNYKIVKDNPSETTILGGINYLSTDMSSSSSILMGYGAFAQFSYKKLGTINIDWRKMYMSIRDDKMFMGEGAKFYNGLDLGGSFAFYNNEASKSIPIVLSSSTSGNTVSTKYINIDGKAKTSFELRAGINTMRNAFKYKFDTIKKYSENELVMYKDTLVYENKSISGNTQRSSFYIGIAKRYVTNLECSISGSYNDYSNFNRAEKIFYADFIVGAGNHEITKFEKEFDYQNDLGWTVSKTVGEKDGWKMDVKEKFGWRVGMEVRSFQGLGMYVKLELGDRPGIHNGSIFGGNLYMLANLGFSLGKGLKIK